MLKLKCSSHFIFLWHFRSPSGNILATFFTMTLTQSPLRFCFFPTFIGVFFYLSICFFFLLFAEIHIYGGFIFLSFYTEYAELIFSKYILQHGFDTFLIIIVSTWATVTLSAAPTIEMYKILS